MADYSLNRGNEYQRICQSRGPSTPWTTDALLLMLDEATNASTAADTMRTAGMVTNGWGSAATAHTASKVGTVTLGTTGTPFTGGSEFCARFAGGGVLKPADTGGDFNFDFDTPFSVCLRVNMNSLASETALIARLVDTTNWRGWMLSVNTSGVPVVRMSQDLGGATDRRIQVFNNNDSLNTSNWFTLGFTYDGSGTAAGVKIYINGVNFGTGTTTDTVTGGDTMAGGTLRIGAADDSFVFGTSADIAGVVIEPRELSAERMARLHQRATNAASSRTLSKNMGWIKGILAANTNSRHFVCGDSTSVPGLTSLADMLPHALKHTGNISRLMSCSLHLGDGLKSGGPWNGITLVGGSVLSDAEVVVGQDPGDVAGAFSIFDSVVPDDSSRMLSIYTWLNNVVDGTLVLGAAGFYDGAVLPGADFPAENWDKCSVNFPIVRLASGATDCISTITVYAARGGEYAETEVPVANSVDEVTTFTIHLADSASGDDIIIGFGGADGGTELNKLLCMATPLVFYSSDLAPTDRGAWWFSQHARSGSYLFDHATELYYTAENVLADIASQSFGIVATWTSTTAWGCLGINDCANYTANLGGSFPTLADVTDAHTDRAADFFALWQAETVQGVIVHPWHPLTVADDGVMDAAWDGVAAAVDAAPDYAGAMNINGLFCDETPDQFLESVGVHLNDGALAGHSGECAYRMWLVVLNEILANVEAEDSEFSIDEVDSQFNPIFSASIRLRVR